MISTTIIFCGTTHCISNSFLMIHPQEYMHVQGGEPKIALSLYNRQQSQVQFLVLHSVHVHSLHYTWMHHQKWHPQNHYSIIM